MEKPQTGKKGKENQAKFGGILLADNFGYALTLFISLMFSFLI